MAESSVNQNLTTGEQAQDCGCGCGGAQGGTAANDCGCGCGGGSCGGATQQELPIVDAKQITEMRARGTGRV